MSVTDRSVPTYFVRIKPPPKKGAPKGSVTIVETPEIKKARSALQRAQADVNTFQGVPTSDQILPYLGAIERLKTAKAKYNNLIAKAQLLAKPAPPPEPFPDITNAVTSFEYEEDEKKPDQLKLTVDNRDLSYFDSPLFEKGTTLLVAWGYAGAMSPAREVVVQKVTGAGSLTVTAHGKAVLMNKETKIRTFENKTRSEIVKIIAKENGYGVEVQDIEETKIRFGVVSQAAQTDAAFLKRLADAEGFEFYVDFDGLHWHKRRFKQKPIRQLTYYLPDPKLGDIIDFDVENDVTAKPGQVVVKGVDPLTKKPFEATADNSHTTRDGLAPVAEVFDPRTAEMVQKPLAATSLVETTNATNVAQAKKEADAKFTRTQQTAVKLKMNIVGDPNIVAKTVVEVRGISKRLSGKYYIHNIKTSITGGTYKMTLDTKTDGGNKGTAAAKSKASPNNQQAPGFVGPVQLTPVETFDKATGTMTTSYKDTRGRDTVGSAG